MSDLEIKVLVGIPASGKSTYVKSLGETHNIVSYDRMRFAFFHGRFDPDIFDYLLNIEALVIGCSITVQKKSICVDNTNLEKETRKQYIGFAEELGVRASAVYFDIPLELALERNAKREGHRYVPEPRMHELFGYLEPPKVDEGFFEVRRIAQSS